MSAPTPDPQFYLSHSGYVRRLARALVFDAHAAEDVEQETWLAASGRAPDDPGAARSWLRSIVRNFAAKARRSAARRAEHEGALRSERSGVATPDDVLEHEAARQRVVEALLALDEPYRTALIARYFQEQSPPQIAAQLDVPLETVRTRLKRGLEKLRERLRRDAGDDQSWGVALASALQLEASRGVVGAPIGLSWCKELIVVNATKKLIGAALAVVLLGVSWWAIENGATSQRGADNVESGPLDNARASAAATDAPRAPEEAPHATREATTAAALPSAPAPTNSSKLGGLAVKLTWSDGSPAAAVAVDLLRPAGVDDRAPQRLGLSDPRGEVLFEALAPGLAIVQPDRGGYAQAMISAGERSAITLQLPRGYDVEGVVLDAQRRPVSDARIFLWRGVTPMLEMHEVARSDARGGFRVRSIEQGTATLLCARAKGFAPTRRNELAAAEGAQLNVELVFPERASAELSGRVVDERGEPVAGAQVLVGAQDSWAPLTEPDGSTSLPAVGEIVTTDERGAFVAEGVLAEPLEVRVRAAGFAPLVRDVDPRSERFVELVLERGARVSGVVTDRAGAPLERVQVRCGEHYEFALRQTVSGADGRFELRDLAAGAVQLVAEGGARGRARRTLQLSRAEDANWDPVLSVGLTIAGRIELRAGASAEGWHAILERLENPHLGGRRTALADAEGRFEFGELADTDYALRVAPPNELFVAWTDEIAPLRPAPGEVVVRPQLAASVRIVGRALGGDGRALESVSLAPLGPRLVQARVTQADAADGRFELAPLPAGAWSVSFTPRGAPARTVGPRDVAPGETWDLGDVVFDVGGTLRIETRAQAGVEERPSWIEVLDARGASVAYIEHADGVWRSGPLAPGRYVVVPGGGEVALTRAEVEVQAGVESLATLELARGVGVRCSFVDGRDAAVTSPIEAQLFDERGALLYQPPVLRSPAGASASLRLAAGRYRLVSTSSDGLRAETEFTLVDGAADSVLKVVLRRR